MATKLKEYFPMIREREEVMAEIAKNSTLQDKFDKWEPRQRCACYSADLLLRQYKRVRSEKKKKFSYRDIKNVYTIVLFEKSPKEFHTYSDTCYHFFE